MMSQPRLWMGIALVLLMTTYRIAGRFPPVTRLLLRLQVVFWTLGYVVRPAYVSSIKPDTPNPLADLRLIPSDYGVGLTAILRLADLGLLAFLVTVIALSRLRSWSHSAEMVKTDRSSELFTLAGLFCFGWVGRAATLAGIGGLSTALSPFATAAVCLAIVRVDLQERMQRRLALFLIISEVLWSVIFASKTPLIALITAFTMRAALRLTQAQLRRRLPLVAVVVVGAFLAIQPLKGINTASSANTYSDTNHSSVTGAVTALLQRVDLLSAVGDAYFDPIRPWQPAPEYMRNLLLSAVPKGPLFEKENAGIRWTKEIRARSYPDQFLGVSLATGPTAEGEVEGGAAGIVALNMILAFLTLVVGRALLSSSLPIALAAALFAFDTVLYERGLLGQAETVAKAIEIVVFTIILQGVSRGMNRPGVARNRATTVAR